MQENSEKLERYVIQEATARGGSLRRYADRKEAGRRWIKAGAPPNFTERWSAETGWRRVWDKEARRQKLWDDQHPQDVAVRVARAEVMLKKRELDWKYRRR